MDIRGAGRTSDADQPSSDLIPFSFPTHTHTHTHTHAHTQTMQTDLVSPLIIAAQNGHTEVVVKLLSTGAKLNHQNKVRSVWY